MAQDRYSVCTLILFRWCAASLRPESSRKAGIMARNVSVVITDDLDGSAGAQSVAFSLDGVSYEIDLAQPNRARLAGALAPFIAAGRRAGRGNRRRGAGTAAGSRVD